jgi:hypothetical protein
MNRFILLLNPLIWLFLYYGQQLAILQSLLFSWKFNDHLILPFLQQINSFSLPTLFYLLIFIPF